MNRAEAFRRIRRIVGSEVCGSMSQVAKRWYKADCRGSEEVLRATEITYRLRLALAALLVVHTGEPKRCPLCEANIPDHNRRCLLGRLLAEE